MSNSPFNTFQIEKLLTLLQDYREDVVRGKVTGYGQSRAEELSDVDDMIDIAVDMQVELTS